MPNWNRDPEDIRLDLAYAFGEGLDPLEYLRERKERGRGG